MSVAEALTRIDRQVKAHTIELWSAPNAAA
jgi:hypothetical protein